MTGRVLKIVTYAIYHPVMDYFLCHNMTECGDDYSWGEEDDQHPIVSFIVDKHDLDEWMYGEVLAILHTHPTMDNSMREAIWVRNNRLDGSRCFDYSDTVPVQKYMYRLESDDQCRLQY